jgi:hypothetical protein
MNDLARFQRELLERLLALDDPRTPRRRRVGHIVIALLLLVAVIVVTGLLTGAEALDELLEVVALGPVLHI